MESIIKDFLSPDSVFYRLRTFNVYGLVVVILKLLADAKKEPLFIEIQNKTYL